MRSVEVNSGLARKRSRVERLAGRFIQLLLCLACGSVSSAHGQEDWALTRRRPGGCGTNRSCPASGTEAKQIPAPGADRLQKLVRRYLHALRRDPTQDLAFRRLLDLYRELDGGMETLATELAQRLAEQPDSYALHVLCGRVSAARGRFAEARESFRQAASLRPEAAGALRAWGRLESQLEKRHKAKDLLDRALKLADSEQETTELLRELGELALDMGDVEAASEYFERLSRIGRDSLGASAEFARALAARGRFASAVDAYRKLLAKMRGDPRVLPSLLHELGKAELRAGDADAAMRTLSRARKLAKPQTGVRWEIQETLLEVHRQAGRLPDLVRLLENDSKAGFENWELRARVWDELGDRDRALRAYRRALSINPRHIDTRVRVVALLSRTGQLAQVLEEYRALVRVAPGEPRFVVELAQLLMESGRPQEAKRLLAKTSGKHRRDPAIHRALYQLYVRWGQQALATRELTILTQIEPRDHMHLVALGEHLMGLGRRDEALAVWRRITRVGPDKAQAHAILGGLYLGQDMLLDALREYRRAVGLRSDTVSFVRGLAQVLERLNRTDEAVKQWERVLELCTQDKSARREARRRIVGIWARVGELHSRVAEYERAFARTGEQSGEGGRASLEAGRFLAEAYQQLARGKQPSAARFRRRAERVLERLTAIHPGDVESLLALERLRLARGDVQGALAVLKRLVEADPRNAPTYLSRMAGHALTVYRDDEAVAYAEKAAALNREDASAHRRLGDLYRARQDVERAMASYRRAIELDGELFAVHLALAELHLSRGETEAADQLLRRVMRASADDELVARATRSAIRLNLGTGTLASLESELLPLALGRTRRPIYRRLLVQLYGLLAKPLMGRADDGASDETRVRERLSAMGKRAIRPLLEALSDPDPEQQRTAVELLGAFANPNAAVPLLAIAEGDGDIGLRRRALKAAGRVAGRELAPRFVRLARSSEGLLRDVAVWALARMGGQRAVRSMRELLRSQVSLVRGYAVLGLGRAQDESSLEQLQRLALEDPNASVRACAALALGHLGVVSSSTTLVAALRGQQGMVAAAAAAALGMLGGEAAAKALAEAVFSPDIRARQAALSTLRQLGSGSRAVRSSELPAPAESPGLEPVLQVLVGRAAESARRAFRPEGVRSALQTAAGDALHGPVESVRAALMQLSNRMLDLLSVEIVAGGEPNRTAPCAQGAEGEPTVEAPAVPRSAAGSQPRAVDASDEASPGRAPALPGGSVAADEECEVSRERLRVGLVRSLLPDLLEVSEHPDSGIRADAVRVLASLEDQRAAHSVLAALDDQEPKVQSVALESLADSPQLERELLVPKVSLIAKRHSQWSIRLRAVEALGRIGDSRAQAALIAATRSDPFAYVREAAVRALGALAETGSEAGSGLRSAVSVLSGALARDPEPRVRVAAAFALDGIGGPDARAALARAGRDAHPAVREALKAIRTGAPPP